MVEGGRVKISIGSPNSTTPGDVQHFLIEVGYDNAVVIGVRNKESL
jgi:hypothetical protein